MMADLHTSLRPSKESLKLKGQDKGKTSGFYIFFFAKACISADLAAMCSGYDWEVGILTFELDRACTVGLQPQNPYPFLGVILAEKGTHS